MTIPAQAGVFSFAPQPAKIGSGTFTSGSYTWYRHRSPRVDMGTQDQVVPFPLETGGPLNPSGMYKTGRFFAGEVDLIPRAQNILGWLLYATMGYASSVTGTPVSGMSTHIFSQNIDNTFYVPWFANRMMIPGQTTAENFGEEGYDCKITSVRIVVPAAGKLAFRFRIVGRKAAYGRNPVWSYGNTFEDSLSSPDSGRGFFRIGGVEYPFTAVELMWMNNLTTPAQERIIGEFEPDDYVPLGGRSLTGRVLYKYEHSGLYQRLLTGSPTGTEWSNLPYIEPSAGAFAFDCQFQSPGNATGSTPYSFGVRANAVNLAQDGNIPLVAGGMVTQSLALTTVDPAAGLSYADMILENANNSGYVWPAA